MALSFPASLPSLADKLDIRSVEWQLRRYDELSGLGSGEMLAAQLAPPRWSGSVSLVAMTHAKAAEVQALFEALDGPMNSFYLYAPQKQFPVMDPDGSILGTDTPTIHTIGVNNRSLRLQGLPEGYVLSVGDFLSFSYGENPERRAFHRVVERVVASSSGVTPLFEMRPHLRPGVAVDLPVALVRPAAKVFVVPDSFTPGTASAAWTEGMSFQVMQRP